MSFYRFPFPNMVKSWAFKGKDLRWAVKVNRLITHTFKFGNKALDIWRKFHKLFEPLKSNIDFYLFQLPPSMTQLCKDPRKLHKGNRPQGTVRP